MKKIHHRTSPIILAILCAVGVHTVLFTDAGHRMQGAITESGTEKSLPDSYLSVENGKLSLITEKALVNVTKMTASLLYDTESVILSSPTTISGRFSQEDSDIKIEFNTARNIPAGTKLITWDMTVSTPESHTINLSDVQVTTSTGTLSLSTRGTGSF